ncbi:MAG: hypothetical protein ACRDJE_06310 [Dehalococcoidia bacterium]
MAMQPLFTADDAHTLRRVVSELRWLLSHQPDLRAGIVRIVRRYEDDLTALTPQRHGATGRGPSGAGSPQSSVAPCLCGDKVIDFSRRRAAQRR